MICQTGKKTIYLISEGEQIRAVPIQELILPILLNILSSQAFNMIPPILTRRMIKLEVSNFIPMVKTLSRLNFFLDIIPPHLIGARSLAMLNKGLLPQGLLWIR